MLQILRNASKSWVAKALMILLIASFGIWGIGDMFRGNFLQRTVATIGKTSIPVQALESEFQKALPEAREVFGPDLTATQARSLGVLERTLNIMIENASFDQEVRRLGINVGEDVVLARIAAYPDLRDKDGNFNAELWKRALARGGLTERGFIDQERRVSGRRLLFESLANHVKQPKTMTDHLYQARGAKRMLEVIALDIASIRDIPEPSTDELKEFYEKHTDLFMRPETRAITMARLASEEITKDVKITEEELKKEFEDRQDEFTRSEQRDFVQVVLQDEGKAKQLTETAEKRGDLSAAARSLGANAVELNGIDEKNVLPELFTTFFALQENQIEGPVKSGLGWHVVQLKKIHPAGKMSFEEVRDSLSVSMREQVVGDTVAHMVNKLDDSLAAGQSLEEIADALKLRVFKIAEIDAKGRLPDGAAPSDISPVPDILNAAFNQSLGESSPVIDDKKGNYWVVRTDSINPSHAEPIEAVQNKVAALWKNGKQAERAKEEAEAIANTLREGKKYTAYAGRNGIKLRLSSPVSLLGEMDKEIPAQAFPIILKMRKDDVITVPTSSHHYVLRLADIVGVDPARPDHTYAKVVDDVNERMGYEQIEQYAKHLRRRFPVKINENVLEMMKTQGTL